MINLKKYVFRKYSEKFPMLFRKERAKLRRILPKAKIEHIGSSAVKGLGGKGIVDIMVSVPKKNYKKALLKLIKNGYNHVITSDRIKDKKFLKRTTKYFKKEKTVHVHLTWENSRPWKSSIALRDYLRKHKDAADRYAQIKRAGVKYAKGEGAKYRAYKHSFLLELNKRAMKEFEG